MKLPRALRKIRPCLVFPDNPSIAQIKHALFELPVVFTQEQDLMRFMGKPDQVHPPDYAIFDGEKFADHTCNKGDFLLRLKTVVGEVVRDHGKKPFVIHTRLAA